MDVNPAISFTQVCFSYGERPILEDATFEVNSGEHLCIVGPNGGGKTTLLKLILGLLKPQSGEISLFGESPVKSRRTIGYVPQHIHFDPLFPISVNEVVLMGCLGNHIGKNFTNEEKSKAEKVIDELGLNEQTHSPFYALSGGQRQRVLIARALIMNPKLLLLDEPTAHVDAQAEAQFREILDRLAEKLTILTVSHDLSFVSAHVKRVLCVNRKVHIHPTEALSGSLVRQLYGQEMRFVQHGHCEGACTHE